MTDKLLSREDMQAEALANARNGTSLINYPAIYEGFAAKGIAQADIKPRENVLTFHAWKALGRSVKRGEHGVKVVTFITEKDEAGEIIGRHPSTSVVFHITQTELTSEREARFAANGYAPRRGGYRRAGWRRNAPPDRDPGAVDPGELAEDRWNETHGDRWQETRY